MLIKMIHLSDNHIGAVLESSSYASEFALRRQREIVSTLMKALDYANAENVHYILLSGDLFDRGKIKTSTIASVIRKFSEFNGTVLLIAGNHDYISEESLWANATLPENVYLFPAGLTQKAFPEHNVVFYGHSWDKAAIKTEELAKMPALDTAKINILLAHGDIYSKNHSYLPIDKNNLVKAGFDYVALGHIHKHDFITKNIAYAGSLEPLNFGETGAHGFISLEFKNKKLQTTFIPFAAREFVIKEITLNSAMSDNDLDAIILNIATSTEKAQNFYRVIFRGRYNYQLNLNKADLHTLYKDEFAYIEFVNNATVDFDLKTLREQNKDNVIGLYIKKFDEMETEDEVIKTAFYKGLELLLDSKEGLL